VLLPRADRGLAEKIQEAGVRVFVFFGLILLASVFAGGAAVAQDLAPTFESEKQKFKVVSLAQGLEYPWGLAFLPNGDMLVTEREGRLNLLRAKTYKREEISGVPKVLAKGQGGLLDVMVHPDFAKNRVIFLSYAAKDEKGAAGTEVLRAELNGTKLENGKVIFRAEPKIKSGNNHFGSRLLWGPDKKLYITLGERNVKKEAQNPSNHLGSIIRINEDGSVPKDNPYVGKEGYRPEIFTYGNRNVQGIALRPGTKQIWAHEHGPKGGDEVNILKAGANYGWPAVTYGVDYTGFKISDKTEGEGFEPPVIYWKPSIAPSGMSFYTGNKFPKWKNNIFVGALVKTHLRRLEMKGDEIVHQEALLEDMGERIRDVRTGPDGYIYVLTDHSDGQVLRLEPAP
jgi:glucose/arabinose dehydrogenase